MYAKRKNTTVVISPLIKIHILNSGGLNTWLITTVPKTILAIS